jgi:hypothetical protein
LGVLAGWRVVRLEGARVGTFEEFAAGLGELKAQEVRRDAVKFDVQI